MLQSWHPLAIFQYVSRMIKQVDYATVLRTNEKL